MLRRMVARTGMSRRWLQVSLRSFLVLATVGGVLASWSARRLLNLNTSGPPGDIVPTKWVVGEFDQAGAWNRASSQNVKWAAQLGSKIYSSPVVSRGKVFVGGDNRRANLKRHPKNNDLAVMLCFDAEDGRLLWRHSRQDLSSFRSWTSSIYRSCSTPLVEGDRLWYVSNGGEMFCLDTEGFRDGENDGPFLAESHKSLKQADIVWKFDVFDRFGVLPLDLMGRKLVVAGDRLFFVTSEGARFAQNVPTRPSFVCLDKNTGKVLWSDNSPGKNILDGHWRSSPAYGVLGGVPQVIFPGGDGWLYSFDPAGRPGGKSKLLWKFDCNPKTSRWMPRGARNKIIATPVIYEQRVYVVVGRDPKYGEGKGRVWCIDPTRRGDVSPELVFNRADPKTPIPHKRLQACVAADGDFTRPNPNSALLWHFDGVKPAAGKKMAHEEQMHRALGTPAIKDDLLFVADYSGILHCLDADTGKQYWSDDLQAACWSSPKVFGDHLYVGNENGVVAVFRASAKPEEAMPLGEPVAANRISSNVIFNSTAADNVLFIAAGTHLFAIEEGSTSGKP